VKSAYKPENSRKQRISAIMTSLNPNSPEFVPSWFQGPTDGSESSKTEEKTAEPKDDVMAGSKDNKAMWTNLDAVKEFKPTKKSN